MMNSEPCESRCSICLGLDKPTWTLTDFEVQGDEISMLHDFSSRDIEGSAKLGCKGCRLIVEVFQYDLSNLEGYLEITGLKSRPGLSVSLNICHYMEPDPDDDPIDPPDTWLDVRELLTQPGRFPTVTSVSTTGESVDTCSYCSKGTDKFEAPADPMFLPHHVKRACKISGNTGSDKAVLQVKAWLNECSEKHTRCRGVSPSVLPTRVLLIEGPENVRLVCSQGDTAPHACLSHCWGARPPLQTTISTYTQYQIGIPLAELPPTFKDAISFTYRLGIKYLWIDSLCILQDSLDDWLHEGSKMSRIYQNAHVTLAAVLSADSSGGLFVSSDPCHLSQDLLTINDDGMSFGMHHREPLSHRAYSRPLDHRGWVFQERLLSPRFVVFERQEIWWECHEMVRCECSGIGLDTDYFSGRLILAGECLRTSTHISDIQLAWEQLVEEYSGKFLAKPGDILPALQGLAKIVPPIMRDYLAGHWSNTFIHSLSWITCFRNQGTKTLEQWRAPTWSWASLPGRVRWGFRGNDLNHGLCTVVSVQTVPKGDDPTGQLVSGKLVMRGKCLSGRIVLSGSDFSPWTINLNIGPNQPNSTSNDCVSFSWDNVVSEGRHRAAPGARVRALQLCESSDGKPQYWLVLTAIDAEATCQRIGIMWIHLMEPLGQETARIYENAAEELEVIIV
ncbi:hypothetical protein EKO04_004762 [Ascochyta lentis]|uniref:Heterokaryon incompatibility domain-containing protein n=1 Tax=Ascochyta lentis TaxID=205686 RepID=A0A8H7J5S6_9PLEO|nr:hypothetical protein EKO04_004762 [Ascochyta lentis]